MTISVLEDKGFSLAKIYFKKGTSCAFVYWINCIAKLRSTLSLWSCAPLYCVWGSALPLMVFNDKWPCVYTSESRTAVTFVGRNFIIGWNGKSINHQSSECALWTWGGGSDFNHTGCFLPFLFNSVIQRGTCSAAHEGKKCLCDRCHVNLKEQACSSPCSDFPVIPVLALRPSTKHRLSSVVDVELCGDVR